MLLDFIQFDCRACLLVLGHFCNRQYIVFTMSAGKNRKHISAQLHDESVELLDAEEIVKGVYFVTPSSHVLWMPAWSATSCHWSRT